MTAGFQIFPFCWNFESVALQKLFEHNFLFSLKKYFKVDNIYELFFMVDKHTNSKHFLIHILLQRN